MVASGQEILRLIGDGGENTLMFTRDALALAQQREWTSLRSPERESVCKLMDYSKFRYRQTKESRFQEEPGNKLF